VLNNEWRGTSVDASIDFRTQKQSAQGIIVVFVNRSSPIEDDIANARRCHQLHVHK